MAAFGSMSQEVLAMARTKDGFDKTHLSIYSKYRIGEMHRDYIAHCFRWSFTARRCGALRINKKQRKILDFGCGKDIPLLNTFMSSRQFDAFYKYVGVDLNTIEIPSNRQAVFRSPKYECQIHSNTNILDITTADIGDVNTVASFEVFEHCPPEVVRPILEHLHSLNDDDGEFIYSTPCYNGKAAKNHINEMSRDCFGWLLEETGHTIIENYGTFANQRDYMPYLSDAELEIVNNLRKYHCSMVLSNFIAPLYPQYSRNNMWVCVKRVEGDERLFPTPGDLPRSQNGYWDND